MAELIGGSGYDDVGNTAPSNPSIGDTWLDTSGGEATGKIYADLGNGADWQVLPVQDELQSGRTRELLLLLQDKPVPEVQDPMNLQTGLSSSFSQEGEDYRIGFEASGVSFDVYSSGTGADPNSGAVINPNSELGKLEFSVASETNGVSNVEVRERSSGNQIAYKGSFNAGSTITVDATLQEGTDYVVEMGANQRAEMQSNTASSTSLDVVNGWSNGSTAGRVRYITNITGYAKQLLGQVCDRFDAPTTPPANFKSWHAIRGEDVTTGSSTSANPVEFEILDSSGTVLTSSRIPASEIADSAFRLRDREYETTAGSDGQAGYQIPETGAGGHYGLPVLSVVTVEQNGSVLDPSEWEFDGDTTVTIDTSAVSVASGDSITISYDFDVFDSTLQPRAYLSREDTSEDSPSISHFRYEYVI